MGAVAPHDFVLLEAVSLPGSNDDGDEFRFPWHAGYVSDVPAAAVELFTKSARGHDGDFVRRGHRGRHALRTLFGSLRAAARHHYRAPGGGPDDSHLGVCAFHGSFGDRSIS